MATRSDIMLQQGEQDISVAKEECNLVIISDLHIGEGYISARRAYSRAERFFSDEAFRNFLRCLLAENNDSGRPLKLIINGDFLDFIRAKSIPDERERKVFLRYFRRLGLIRGNDDFEIQPSESRFGLGTEEHKSVWKLHRICKGHPIIFEALAEFLAAGNRLVIIKGNHDLEFFWPAVQEELVKLLASSLPKARANGESACDRIEMIRARVEFCQRAYIVENQVYIEHGHQYERMTRVQGALLNGRELRLPAGSILNYYLVNAIEHLAPLVTRVRGNFKVMRTLIASHRWRALRLLMRHFPVATKMLLRGDRRVAVALLLELVPYLFLMAYASFVMLLPALWPDYATALVESTGRFGQIFLDRWFLNAAFGIGAFGVLRYLVRKATFDRKFFLQEAFQRARERMLEARARVRKFLVLGHTHLPGIQALDDDWWYINTGTWAPAMEVLSIHRLRESHPLTFVEFVRRPNGSFDFDLRIWNDHKGRSERYIIWE